MITPLPVAVLVSGHGTNLQAIINEREAGKLPIAIKVVISNDSSAYALKRAEQHGIPTHCISHKKFDSREAFDSEITKALESFGVELVVLAGFNRILSSHFVKHWKFRLINIHPSLVPAFPGLHAQRQAIEYGVKIAGCSVFFVDEGVDTGPIIIQSAVPVFPDDTEDTLTARILEQEHLILPLAIYWIATDQIYQNGRHVISPKSDVPLMRDYHDR